MTQFWWAPRLLLRFLQSSSLWSREKGGLLLQEPQIFKSFEKLLYSSSRGLSFFSPKRGYKLSWVSHMHPLFLDGPLLSNLINTGQRTYCSGSRSQELCLGTQKRVSLTKVPMGTPQGWSQVAAFCPEFFQQTFGNKLHWEDLSALIVWLYSWGV